MVTYLVTPSTAHDARTAGRDRLAADLAWCTVADETVWWHQTADPLPAGLLRLAGAPSRSVEGDLYLVGQAGGSFTTAFPHARVVIDQGRHLVVVLTPADLTEVERQAGSCFGISPVPQRAVAVTPATRPAVRRPAREIASLTAMVSEDRLVEAITTLATLATRHSLSSGLRAAADWAQERLESSGFAVSRVPISVHGTASVNLVAERAGTAAERRLVVVTAHLDSVNTAGGQQAPAPGADDNASGAAGALEIGRILGGLSSPEHDLQVILFGGEEQGLLGSRQHVAGLGDLDRSRLDAVVNMDMIGRLNVAEPTVLLEGAPVSQRLMDDLGAAAGDHTSLLVQTSLHPFASDHVPFLDAGLPAVLTIEGSDAANTAVHTAEDLPSTIHPPLAVEIVRMNLAVVAARLGTGGTVPATGP